MVYLSRRRRIVPKTHFSDYRSLGAVNIIIRSLERIHDRTGLCVLDTITPARSKFLCDNIIEKFIEQLVLFQRRSKVCKTIFRVYSSCICVTDLDSAAWTKVRAPTYPYGVTATSTVAPSIRSFRRFTFQDMAGK